MANLPNPVAIGTSSLEIRETMRSYLVVAKSEVLTPLHNLDDRSCGNLLIFSPSRMSARSSTSTTSSLLHRDHIEKNIERRTPRRLRDENIEHISWTLSLLSRRRSSYGGVLRPWDSLQFVVWTVVWTVDLILRNRPNESLTEKSSEFSEEHFDIDFGLLRSLLIQESWRDASVNCQLRNSNN